MQFWSRTHRWWKRWHVYFFNWTLDDGTHNASNYVPRTPEGNSEDGSCADQNILEHNLHVWRTIRSKIIKRGRPIPPVFRMLSKLIAHWNFTKGRICNFSWVTKNHKPPFTGLNGYAFICIRLMSSGVYNTRQVTKAVLIVPRLHKHTSLEQLNEAFSRHISFCKTIHTISKHYLIEDRYGGH